MDVTPHPEAEAAPAAGPESKVPLHVQVRQILRKQILHDFKDGQRFYSERELLKRLKVSQPTIRHAMRYLQNEGFLTASPRRGFFVRKQPETQSVGVFIPAYESAFAEKHLALDAIADACRTHNYPLHVYYTHKQDAMSDLLGSLRAPPSEERIILCGQALETLFHLRDELDKRGYWTVAMGGALSTGYSGSLVDIDHTFEVSLALDHLVGLGHQRILFLINEPEIISTIHPRLVAIKHAIKARDLARAEIVYCGTKFWDSSFDAACRRMEDVLAVQPWPTAIVPISGIGSWAALKSLMRRKIQVPETISILSLDDLPGCEWLPVGLTTLSVSLIEKAERVIALLWGERKVEVELIKPRLVTRESTAKCAMPF